MLKVKFLFFLQLQTLSLMFLVVNFQNSYKLAYALLSFSIFRKNFLLEIGKSFIMNLLKTFKGKVFFYIYWDFPISVDIIIRFSQLVNRFILVFPI
nr:MAG TPA: hypothetical protein [Caudoviricetes sp.]